MASLWAPFSPRASRANPRGISVDIPELRERVRISGLPEIYLVVGVDLTAGVADLVSLSHPSAAMFDVPFSSVFRLEQRRGNAGDAMAV